MKITPLTHCKTKWEIQPKRHWPRWIPAVIWKDIVIAGSHTAQTYGVDVTDRGDWADAVIGSYESLSVYDLSRLQGFTEAQGMASETLLSRVARSFGFHWSSDLTKCLHWLSRCPEPIRQWAESKHLSAGDLRPLFLLPEDSAALLLVLRAASAFQPSHSDGVKLIEWAVDLELSGQLSKINDDDWRSLKTLLNKMYALRYPQTQAADQRFADSLKRVPWPSQTTVRSFRQGDRAALELRVTAHSLPELKNRIAHLRDSTEHL